MRYRTKVDRVVQKPKLLFLKYLSETFEAEVFENAILRTRDETLSYIVRKESRVLNLLLFFSSED